MFPGASIGPSFRGQMKPEAMSTIPRINWAHPLAQGLVFYGFDLGNVVIDLVSDTLGSKTGTVTPSLTPFGSALNYDPGVDGNYTQFNMSATVAAALNGPCTFACAIQGYSYSGNPAALGFGTATLSAGYGFWNGTGDDWSIFSPSSGTIGSAALGTSGFQSLAGVLTSTTSATLYANGVGGSANSVSAQTFASGDSIYIGGDPTTDWGDPSVENAYYAAIWLRPLSAAELLQLHLNPYCFLIFPTLDEIFDTLAVVSSGTLVALTASGFLRVGGYGIGQGALPLVSTSCAIITAKDTPSLQSSLAAISSARVTWTGTTKATQSLSSRARASAASSGGMLGKVAFSAVTSARSMARGASSAVIGLSAATALRVYAKPVTTALISLVSRTRASVFAPNNMQALSNLVALTATGSSRVMARGSIAGKVALYTIARSSVASKAAQSATAALSGFVRASVAAKGGLLGITGLSGKVAATVRLKAFSATYSLLSGMAHSRIGLSATQSAKAALSGLSSARVAVQAGLAGGAALSGRIRATGSMRGIARGAIQLSANVGASVSARGVTAGKMALSAVTSAVVTAQGYLSGRLPLIALSALGRGMVTANGVITVVKKLFVDTRYIVFEAPRVFNALINRVLVTDAVPRNFVSTTVIPGMPLGNPISTIDPGVEQVNVTFDFGKELECGSATITAVLSVSCAVAAESAEPDPSPSSRIIGSPQITTSPTTLAASAAVIQQFGGYLPNVTYLLQCLVLTSDGQHLNRGTYSPSTPFS